MLLDLYPSVKEHIPIMIRILPKVAHIVPELLQLIIDDNLLLYFTPQLMGSLSLIEPHLDLLLLHRHELFPLLSKIAPYLEIIERNLHVFRNDMDILIPKLPEMAQYIDEVGDYMEDLIEFYKLIPDTDTKIKILGHLHKLVKFAHESIKFKNDLLPYIVPVSKHIDILIQFEDLQIEPFIPYLPQLIPFLDECAPFLTHFTEIASDIPDILPYIIEHIDVLVPTIHKTAVFAPRLLHRTKWAIPRYHRLIRIAAYFKVLPFCAKMLGGKPTN